MSSAFFEFSIGSPGQIDRMMKETVEFTRAAKITQKQATAIVKHVAKQQVAKITHRVEVGRDIRGNSFTPLAHSTTQASKPRPALGAPTIKKAVRGSGRILNQSGRGFKRQIRFRMGQMKHSAKRDVNVHAVIDVANVTNHAGKNARDIATALNFGHKYPAMTSANLKHSRYFRLPFPNTISLRKVKGGKKSTWVNDMKVGTSPFEPRQGRRLRRSKKKFAKTTRGMYTTKIGPRVLPAREFFGISDEETVRIAQVFMYFFIHRKRMTY